MCLKTLVMTSVLSSRLEEDVRQRILNGEGIYIHCETPPRIDKPCQNSKDGR